MIIFIVTFLILLILLAGLAFVLRKPARPSAVWPASINKAGTFWKPAKNNRAAVKRLASLALAAAVVTVLVTWIIWTPERSEPGIVWEPYSKEAVVAAHEAEKWVIIDVFADWCLPCKQMEQSTFSDPDVAAQARQFVTLKVDLTARDPGLEASLNIRRVPTVIFLDSTGLERTDLRLEAFEKADLFLARLRQVHTAAREGSD